MNIADIKTKILEIRRLEYSAGIKIAEFPIGTKFRSTWYAKGTSELNWMLIDAAPVRLRDFSEDGVTAWCNRHAQSIQNPAEKSYYGYVSLNWEEIGKNKELTASLAEWIEKVTPNIDVVKNGGVITFTKRDTQEKLYCDLNKQTFVRTYKKGKDRQINYPMQFFKYFSGRVLISMIEDKDCEVFGKLVKEVSSHYSQCRNFGTFLVRMFDHIHLEQYVAAGVNFDFNIPFSYTDFDKDMRAKFNENGIRYTESVGALFCSDKDVGRAIFAQIKDKVGFKAMVTLLSVHIQALNTLVNHYHYDLKTLFAYCRERKWQAHTDYEDIENRKDQYFSTYSYNIISYLRDYARMARQVYGEDYEKYPKNLTEAHNETSNLFHTRKIDERTQKCFEDIIDKKLEWENKEFKVIYPKTAEEIIEEGKSLKHCVGSYIQSVISGDCAIVFLRSKENENKPLVTIEISNGSIRQARGQSNSVPKYDARIALKEYAKSKKLMYIG